MSKKLITACMALFALAAFILPASASAVTTITHPTGTALAAGTTITGTNTTGAKFIGAGITLVECSSVKLTGTLLENKEGKIKGNVTTATFSGTGSPSNGMNECSGSGGTTPTTNGGGVDGENVTNGTPWCMTNEAGTDEFTVRGGLCSEATRAMTFILHTTSFGTCSYTRSTAIKGTFTTDTTGDAIVSLAQGANTEFTREATSGPLCPEKGSLEMSFTLETDVETASPLYVSA